MTVSRRHEVSKPVVQNSMPQESEDGWKRFSWVFQVISDSSRLVFPSQRERVIAEGKANQIVSRRIEAVPSSTMRGVVSKIIQQSWKTLRYEVSLGYTLWGWSSGPWWSKIEPYPLYIGAIPLKNKGHLKQIQDLGVTAIVSAVEDFELKPGWIHTPVQESEWKESGIDVKRIHAVDFRALKREDFAAGLSYITQQLADENTVYVHCKAGRGRSAALVIAYLMQEEKLPFLEAMRVVKKHRPRINLNATQQKAVQDYFLPPSAVLYPR